MAAIGTSNGPVDSHSNKLIIETAIPGQQSHPIPASKDIFATGESVIVQLDVFRENEQLVGPLAAFLCFNRNLSCSISSFGGRTGHIFVDMIAIGVPDPKVLGGPFN